MSADSAGVAALVVAPWVSLPVLCHSLRPLATCSLSPAGQGVGFFFSVGSSGFQGLGTKVTQCQFCLILVKAIHKSGSDSRGRDRFCLLMGKITKEHCKWACRMGGLFV